MAMVYYLLRSRQSGQYLFARQPSAPPLAAGQLAAGQPEAQARAEQAIRYLLLFQQDYDGLSYLNAHAPELSDRFALESSTMAQLRATLERWGFGGVALVSDPLEPRLDFLNRDLLG
jgi:hypothetical protein